LGEVAHHLGVADAKRVATLAAGLAVQLTAVEAEVAAPEVGEVAVVATPADAAAEVEVRALVVEPSEVAELLRLVADVESTGVDAAGRALRIRARRALPLRGVDLRRRCARDAEDAERREQVKGAEDLHRIGSGGVARDAAPRPVNASAWLLRGGCCRAPANGSSCSCRRRDRSGRGRRRPAAAGSSMRTTDGRPANGTAGTAAAATC